MRRPGLRLLSLLLGGMAGCAAQSDAQAARCVFRIAAEIPVSLASGFISAAAEIDDVPVAMLIDSGAEASMVTPVAQAALALLPDPHHRTVMHGIGGTVASQNAMLPSVRIGGMEMLHQSVAVGPLPVGLMPGLRAAGLLGADWLSVFSVEFDLPHGRMALYRVQGCADGQVPWQGRTISVPMRVYGRGVPMLPVTLDGHRMLALLDSGAVLSSLTDAASAQLGLTAAQLAGDRHGHAMGVDGTVLDAYRHRFDDLQVGEVHDAGPTIAITPIRLPIGDMLLGTDWLRRHRVWIDYAGQRVVLAVGG